MADPAFVSATGAVSGGTNTATVTTSGGAVPDGRLMYALVNTGGAGSAAITPPAGWSTLDTGTFAGAQRYGLFYKIASGEGTTQSFVSSDATNVEAYVVVVSDPNTSTPNDAPPAKNTGTATTMTFGDITTVTNNALSLLLAVNLDFYPTMPGSYTSGGHSANTISAAYATKATAGLITGLTGTGSGSGWATYSIAIRPAGGGGSATGRLVNGNLVNGSLIGSMVR